MSAVYKSLAPAHFESLVREYLYGRHLPPLRLAARHPHGRPAADRVAAERLAARRRLQRGRGIDRAS